MRKYVTLLSALFIHNCLGGFYAWSVFVPPLKANYGITAAQAGSIFGMMIANFALAMVAAGKLQSRLNSKIIVMMGAILFGSGYYIASLSAGSYLILVLGISITVGWGLGLAYVAPLSNAVKSFPKERAGLITGLIAAAFALGAILFSKTATYFYNQGLDVLQVFCIIGIGCMSIMFLSSLVQKSPKLQEGQKPVSSTIPTAQLMGDVRFWALAIAMFAGTFPGLMVVGNLKPLALAQSMPESMATMAIMFFAVGNSIGRILWGMAYDKWGGVTIPISLIWLGAAVLLIGQMNVPYMFLPMAFLLGNGHSAAFVLPAADIASGYGTSKVSCVYPMVLLFFGVSGVSGSPFAGWCYSFGGSYLPATLVAGVIAFSGSFAVKRFYAMAQNRAPAAEIA